MQPLDLWLFFPIGYLLTVAIETPVLMMGLSPRHRASVRLAAGFWLTACTYPVVVLVLPLVFASSRRIEYLVVAETFAPLAECLAFALAFHTAEMRSSERFRDFAVITLANLASFGFGEVINWRLSHG